MTYIGAFLILLLISIYAKIHLNFKMEESVFLSIGFIIIILTISGIFGLMNIGQYFLYFIAICSFAYVIYYFIKVQFKYDFSQIITPGLLIILLSYIIYMIITKNNVMYFGDEASCYGTAAHYMHVTDKISNGGSLTVFSYFFTKIVGYSDHDLFVSRWLFSWICLALPLSYVKWDKWYMVAIYAILSYGIITIIDPETQYMMDASVGIVAGAGIAYLSTSRQQSRTIILIIASILTITVKDNIGLILFAFMALFFVLYYAIELQKKQWYISKKNVLNLCIFIISIIITFIIKQIIIPVDLLAAIEMFNEYKIFILFIIAGIIGIIILWLAWLHKPFKKYIIDKISKNFILQKVLKIVAIAGIPFMVFSIIYKICWRILYTLDMKLQYDFVYGLNKYFGREYFGLSLSTLILLLLISSIFCSLTIIKKDNKVSFITQSISIVLMLIIYGFIIALLYIKVYNAHLINMMGAERYIGSLLIMICIWLISIVFTGNDYWIEEKKQYIASFGVFLLLIRCMPLPGEIMFSSVTNKNMIGFKHTIRPMFKEHAIIINNNTPEDAKILIISQNYNSSDSNLPTGLVTPYWMHYEMVPRHLPGFISITTEKPEQDDIVRMTLDKFNDTLKKYEYVYIANANDKFFDEYGELFESEAKYYTKAIYKINIDKDQPLEFIYAINNN